MTDEQKERRVDQREVLSSLREELAGVRQELVAKGRSYRRLVLAGVLATVAFVVLLSVVLVVAVETRRTVTATNNRGQENKSILANMTTLLADVDSVTNPTQRAKQDLATQKLVHDAVCSIYVGLRHSDPTVPFPAGCQP